MKKKSLRDSDQARNELLKSAMRIAEDNWQERCMAITASKKRCLHRGTIIELTNSEQVLLCTVHRAFQNSPDKIGHWPDKNPAIKELEKHIAK